jgi:hypothetical protein
MKVEDRVINGKEKGLSLSFTRAKKRKIAK